MSKPAKTRKRSSTTQETIPPFSQIWIPIKLSKDSKELMKQMIESEKWLKKFKKKEKMK